MTNLQLPLADNWAHAYGGVCSLHYTIVWCTKFCRRVLVADVSDRVDSLLRQLVVEAGGEARELAIYPNYIRMEVVLYTPKLAPAQLIYHLKRTTSHIVCLEYPIIQRRLKSLWTRSYLIKTDENLPDEVIARYVASQRGR